LQKTPATGILLFIFESNFDVFGAAGAGNITPDEE
jgi:hypothetical protein